jgi:uncharacterized membrane protein
MIEHNEAFGTRAQEIAQYVERVRVALADLPPALRDDLLEDLPEHLTEVAAEADGSLVDRLGSAEAYASELRAAAGVSAPTSAPNLDRRISVVMVSARRRLRAADTKLGPIIGYARLSEFISLLRPAWWVLRGYLAAMFIAVVLTGQSYGLLPRLGDSNLAALLLLGATVVGSIWLGQRSGGYGRWPRRALNVGTALIVLFGGFWFLQADRQRVVDAYYSPSSSDGQYSHIQDVFVYDQQGRLVENARLFDQLGQPIQLGNPWCPESQQVKNEQIWQAYPYCPREAPFRSSDPVREAPAPDETRSPPADMSPGPGRTTPSPVPVPSGSPDGSRTPGAPSTGPSSSPPSN